MNLILNKNPFTMNTKRILFGLMACLMLVGASCTPNTADDENYETNSIDRKIGRDQIRA